MSLAENITNYSNAKKSTDLNILKTIDDSGWYTKETLIYKKSNQSAPLQIIKIDDVGNNDINNSNFRANANGDNIGFIVSNIKLLTAITLGVALVSLVLLTWNIVVKTFSAYHTEDYEPYR